MFRSSFVLAFCLLSALGCSEKVAEFAAEKAMEASAGADGTDVDVDIDSKTGSMTISSADGDVVYKADGEAGSVEISSAQGSVVAGNKAAVPADFPEDVPVYDGFKPEMVTEMPGNNAYNMSGTVSGSLDEIKTYYEKEAAESGWESVTTVTQGQMVMLQYKKEERVMNVSAAVAGNAIRLNITTANTN